MTKCKPVLRELRIRWEVAECESTPDLHHEAQYQASPTVQVLGLMNRLSRDNPMGYLQYSRFS